MVRRTGNRRKISDGCCIVLSYHEVLRKLTPVACQVRTGVGYFSGGLHCIQLLTND